MKFNDPKSNYSQGGYSLLELLMAMIIFLIVTASIYGLLQIGRIDRNRSSRHADSMKNARAAIHLIGRDALNAGLGYSRFGAQVPDGFLANRFDVPADTDTDRDNLTPVVVGNNIHENDLQSNASILTDVVAFASREVVFNKGNVMLLRAEPPTSGSADTAQFQTRTARAAAEEVKRFDLFLIGTDTSQVLVMATNQPTSEAIDFAPNDPLGLNQPLNGSGSGSSIFKECTRVVVANCTTYQMIHPGFPMKRVNLVSYKVKRDGTLVRTTYGNNVEGAIDEQIREQPLAYNVKNLQFKYLLNNGRVTDNPAAGADNILGTADDTPDAASLVTQITVTIQVAATESDEQMGEPTVITLNATFSTRNLQYDAG